MFENRKPGQEDWEVYAEAVREILGKALDMPLSDEIMESKLEYKELIYKKKQE